MWFLFQPPHGALLVGRRLVAWVGVGGGTAGKCQAHSFWSSTCVGLISTNFPLLRPAPKPIIKGSSSSRVHSGATKQAIKPPFSENRHPRALPPVSSSAVVCLTPLLLLGVSPFIDLSLCPLPS